MHLESLLSFETEGDRQSKITSKTTPIMTKLANEGLILDRHYAHWHCSPSRRSFLTGRLPIHTSEELSGEFDDHMDIRWSLISEKLKKRDYYKKNNQLPDYLST